MRRPGLGIVAFLRIARVALAALVTIIITGSLVRLTGSGLGCVDWPACNQERFVDVSSGHAAIEQVNRLFTGVVAAAVIAAVLSALVLRPRRVRLVWWSVALVVGVLAQVVVGGIVVLTGLNPWSNMAHFLISMVLVTAAVILIHETRSIIETEKVVRLPLSYTMTRELRNSSVFVALLGLVVVVVGTVVTATGPHAGDENAIRFGLDLTVVVRVHAIAVWIFLAALVASAVLVRKASAHHLVRPLEIVIGWTLAQGLVGYVQYFSGVPVFLVAIHVAGSVFVWMAVMRYVLQVLTPVHQMV